jgi:hypothetical protein
VCLDGAGCGLTCRLAAARMAGTGPGVALCLWRLAPRLAPRHLVSNANAQTIDTLDSSIKCVRRSTDRGERHPRDEASLLSLLASRGGVIRCPR